MTNGEAVIWLINIAADIGKAEHRDLWHYEQALCEIREMLESAQPDSSFITWLLDEIWDEDMWELNWQAFPEIVCRKLVKLGFVKERNGEYERLDRQAGGNRCGA